VRKASRSSARATADAPGEMPGIRRFQSPRIDLARREPLVAVDDNTR
jgi:hypothetical protein